MGYFFLVTIFLWACVPMMTTALNCYQCETEDTFKSCLTNTSNLDSCDDGDVCYKFSGNWEGESIAFRGCINKHEGLYCKYHWEYCLLTWSNEDCEIPCIAWVCYGALDTKVESVTTNASVRSGILIPTKAPMNATDMLLCYCDTDGCNGSFRRYPPALYIIFTLSSFSVVLTRTRKL